MEESRRRPWFWRGPTEPSNYYSSEDCSWNDPTMPPCAICGQLILADPNARDFFREVDNFNAASGNKHHIKLKVEQMHGFLAGKNCDWRSTYRAIVKLRNQERPIITGVSYRHSGFGKKGQYCIGAPIEQDDAWLIRGAIHPRGQIAWFTRYCGDGAGPVHTNTGLPMHESCYQLLMRFFDDKRIEPNLFSLMYSLWGEFLTKRRDWKTYGEPPEDSGAKEMVKYDPLFITNYYEVFQTAIDRGRSTYVSNRGYRGVRTQAGFHISMGAFSKLPIELALMILEHCEGQQFRNFILAGRLAISDDYWKQAIPTCVFELHEDLEDADLDWRYLGLEFHRLIERKDGLWHRLSIMNYMPRIWVYYTRQEMHVIKDKFIGVA